MAAFPPPPSRLLVVGADPGRQAAFATWQRMGLQVTVVDGDSSARYDALAQESWAWDVRDESADLDRLAKLAEHADGIVTLSDGSQQTAAALAAGQKLPGAGTEAAGVARSKDRQRAAMRAAGLPVPRWRTVTSAADIDAYFQGAETDSVLKPVDGSASSAVHLVSDAEQARRKWPVVRQFSKAGRGILEEFVAGDEISVEAAVVAGEVVFCSVTRKATSGPPGFLETGHTVAPPAAEPLTERAGDEVRRVVAAFGVRDTVVHAEFRILGDRWTLVEAAGRPAGDMIPDLVARVHGADLYELQARIACGTAGGYAPPPAAAEHAGIRFALGTGRVRRQVPPRTCLDGLATVHRAAQLIGSGRNLGPVLGNWDRLGYALGWARDAGLLQEELGRATERLCAAALGTSGGSGGSGGDRPESAA